MRHSCLGLILLSVLVFTASCGLLKNAPERNARPESGAEVPPPVDLRSHIRDNCASLLNDLLNEEKNLSKLLIIKRESDELHELVKQISETSRRAAEQLKQMAVSDHTLHLKAAGLPSGEAATRDAVSKTKTDVLLHSKGAEFEFQLLLTQAEALNYGAHLAKVAAQNESRPENTKTFTGIQRELENLYGKVCAMLRDNGAAPNSK